MKGIIWDALARIALEISLSVTQKSKFILRFTYKYIELKNCAAISFYRM